MEREPLYPALRPDLSLSYDDKRDASDCLGKANTNRGNASDTERADAHELPSLDGIGYWLYLRDVLADGGNRCLDVPDTVDKLILHW